MTANAWYVDYGRIPLNLVILSCCAIWMPAFGWPAGQFIPAADQVARAAGGPPPNAVCLHARQLSAGAFRQKTWV